MVSRHQSSRSHSHNSETQERKYWRFLQSIQEIRHPHEQASQIHRHRSTYIQASVIINAVVLQQTIVEKANRGEK